VQAQSQDVAVQDESSAHQNRSRGGGGNAYEGKYSGTDEVVICQWIREVTGDDIDPHDLQGCLRTGQTLCKLVNSISPKAVKKVNTSTMPFAQRENIQNFCDAVARLGVKDINCFAADDLFEGKNLKQVTICIQALGKLCWAIPDYSGPAIGKNESINVPKFSVAIENGAGATSSQSLVRNKSYKWEVKKGGSFVPTVPSAVKKEMLERDSEQHQHQRKWEVKFAPQLATAARRTMVVSSDVMNYLNQFSHESQLRTAVGTGEHVSHHNYHKNAHSNEENKPNQDVSMCVNPSGEAADEAVVKEYNENEYDGVDEDGGSAYQGVPPAGVVEGLMMMLTSPDATEKAKAAAALCNICSETDSNRELVVNAGGLPSLIDMLMNPSPEVPFMQSAAAACICNLAANINSKEVIATSGALEVLVVVLRSDNQAAAAQAAGALWSLCVDNDQNKQRVTDAGAIPHLIALLYAVDTFAQSQSAGALSECSIRNDTNKRLISEHGAILPLVKMLRSQDLSVQRLSSCALCNVCANHEANKRQAREVGALPVLVHLLSTSQVPEVLSPVAGAMCNLSMKCPENKAEFVRLGAPDILRHLVASPIPSLHGNALAALEQLELG
jgi:hypothetical protein